MIKKKVLISMISITWIDTNGALRDTSAACINDTAEETKIWDAIEYMIENDNYRYVTTHNYTVCVDTKQADMLIKDYNYFNPNEVFK